MSDAPKKEGDNLNTFGIVVIGVVATFVTWALVVALQAYYGHTEGAFAQEREVAGQDAQRKSMRAQQTAELKGGERNATTGTGTIAIEVAMDKVREQARAGAPSLVPAIGSHDKPTVPAVWGRPPDDAKPPVMEPEVPGEVPAEGAEGGDAAAAEGAAPAGATSAPSGAPANPATPPARQPTAGEEAAKPPQSPGRTPTPGGGAAPAQPTR